MASPLRILQVLPALNSGGVERGTLDLNAALVAQGHQSFCASHGGQLVKELEAAGGTHISMPAHSKNPLTIWRNIRTLSDIIRQHHIDLIHVRSRAPAWSVYHASRLCDIPMVSTFHGQYGSQSALKRWYNSGMLKADTTIAVSDFISHHIADTYPNHHSLVTRIYRGIDTSYFSPDNCNVAEKNALRLQWGLPADAQNIIMLPGRLTRLKGHKLFIEALSILTCSNFRAVIVGDIKGRDEYVTELYELAKRLGLKTTGPEQQLYFAGGCSDMPAAYSLADIIVSASTKPEAFGRIACEAQSMGKPVVATDHGGTCETLHASQHQGRCEPGSAPSLASALTRQLSLSDESLKAIAKHSRQHIVELFSVEKMCAETIEVYNKVISKRGIRES